MLGKHGKYRSHCIRSPESVLIISFLPCNCRKVSCNPGSALHGYLSKILARTFQDLRKILAKILPRYCQELQDVLVGCYQESHVTKKNFIVKSYLGRKEDLKGSQQKYTSMQIYIVRHDNFLQGIKFH